jgi:hypothetical protein
LALVPVNFTPTELWNATLLFSLICGRNKAVMAGHPREWACYYARRLNTRASLEGLPQPKPPFHIGSIIKLPPGAA